MSTYDEWKSTEPDVDYWEECEAREARLRYKAKQEQKKSEQEADKEKEKSNAA